MAALASRQPPARRLAWSARFVAIWYRDRYRAQVPIILNVCPHCPTGFGPTACRDHLMQGADWRRLQAPPEKGTDFGGRRGRDPGTQGRGCRPAAPGPSAPGHGARQTPPTPPAVMVVPPPAGRPEPGGR